MQLAPGGEASVVVEDHSTLQGEPQGTETRYSIALMGRVDERWAEAFRITGSESPIYQRFRLDRTTNTIHFSCRTVDGAVLVFDVLQRLEMFLKAVNERVEFWHTQNPAVVSNLGARGVA
ncbi:MAG: hypothetical protein ABI968_04170 [Acidobacteriota bacterium]